MVVGGGQLARAFNQQFLPHSCIFASGVSNSSCTNSDEFAREEQLLIKTLTENKDKQFVYFSSCALSAPDYPKNAYYQHKHNMENIIQSESDQYYIFRIPQLFGDLILHKTLINFIYKCISHHHHFTVFNDAHRYVIEINDVATLVMAFLRHSSPNITVDIANPHRYSVQEIVSTIELLLGHSANYALVEKSDQYTLTFEVMNAFIKAHQLPLKFGQDYLHQKLQAKITSTLF